MNVIISCLKDDNLLVKKNIIDFMITHIKLKGGPFSYEDKIELVQAALNLMLSTDGTIFRRINTWLFGIHD